MKNSKTYIAIPPGETIKEQLEIRGMTQKEFSKRMGMTEKHISKLINGEVQLTIEMATKLEMVLNISAQFWCNLESIYREDLLKVEEENSLDQELQILKLYPYNEMSNHGWVKKTNKPQEKVHELRKFFEVANLALISDQLIPNIACRRLSTTQKSDRTLIVWSQKAKIESRKYETKSINIKKLNNNIQRIRTFTTMSPDEFCPKLISLLSECGISLVFLPHLKGSYQHGATFLDGKKIVLAMSLRGKDADKFWFTLFHELGHIIFNHIQPSVEISNTEESLCDEYARNILIPSDEYQHYLSTTPKHTVESIIMFAKKINIDYGIVVGRLQNDTIIPYTHFNELKTKYEITD